MVFQQFNLFPNMSVKENIMLAPMKLKGMSKEEAGKRAEELLDRVGLLDKRMQTLLIYQEDKSSVLL